MQKQTQLANELWPLLLPRVQGLLGSAGGAGGTGGGAVGEHLLSGSLHTGQLADAQAPQFLKLDGSRPLIGDLAVTDGVTIDGVDLSAHAADPNAHHAQVHGIVSADHTVTGLAWQVIGLTATDTLGMLSPLADVTGITREALLKSNSAGEIALTSLILSTGRLRSNAAFEMVNAVGLAYKDLAAADIVANGDLTTTSGWLRSNSTIMALTITGAAQRVMAGSVGVSSSYAPGEEAKIPINGIYSSGAIRGDVKLTTPKIDTLTGNLLIDPAAWTTFADNKDVRSVSHLAGFLGQGWRISWPETDRPHLDIRSIYAETLEVTAFQADIMRVRIAEDFLTQGMAFTAEPFTTPSAIGGTVRVMFEDNPAFDGQLFLANEWVMFNIIQKNAGLVVAQIWGQMSAYQDEAAVAGMGRQSWLFTLRNGNVSFVVPKASIALAWGVSGQKNGYIHHNVLASAYGPWTRYGSWSGANPYTVADRTYHLQTGNLRGLVDITTDRYGIAAGNNLAKTPTDPTTPFRGFTADNSGGLRLFNSAISSYIGATQKFYLSPDGTEMWLGVSPSDKRFHYLSGDLTITGTFEAGGSRFRAASDGVRIAVTDQSWSAPFEVLSFRAITLAGPEQAYIGMRSYDPSLNPVGSVAPNTAGTSTSSDFQLALAAWGKVAGDWGSIALRAREGGQSTLDDTVGATLLVTPRNVWIGPNAGLRISASVADLETPVPAGELYVGIIHATQVIADTVSGAEFSGAQWQYPGSVVIDAMAASDQNVTITNSGTGRADLVVDRNISLGGTVDGIDVSAFYAAYAAHNHSLASLSSKPHSALTGIGADDHHAQAHGITSADHTASGLTAGHVLRASGAATFAFAQLGHGDLGGVTADQHHAQVHGIITSNHTVVGSTYQVIGLTALNTLGLLTPLADVTGATKEAILKSNTLGEIALTAIIVTAGRLRSNAAFEFVNAVGSAYQDLAALDIVANGSLTTGNGWLIGGGTIKALTTLAAAQRVMAGSIGVSSSYAAGEEAKIPANGIYSLGAIRGDVKLTTPLIDTLSGSLTLSPVASLILSPGSNQVQIADGKGIQTATFASGFAGSGFRLDQGVTSAGKTSLEVDNLTVRGQMSVYEMLIRQIRATNGAVFVSSTARVQVVTAIAGGYSLSTVRAGETPTATSDHAHGFLVGDLIRAQRVRWDGSSLISIYLCDLRVTAVTNCYIFEAVQIAGSAPTAGMEFVRIGSSTDVNRRGSIYMTADDTNAPFIDVVDGIASHGDWNTAGKVKVRVGKLTGISGQTDTYGIFSGNPAATWQSMETVNGFRIGVAGTVRFGVDTSGNLRLFNSAGTNVIALDNDGSSYFAGVMTIGLGGEIRQGSGVLGTNYTGLRIWRDGAVGRIAGYNNNVEQWSANTAGQFAAGAGAVVLDANGERLYRPIEVVTTGSLPPSDFGQYPNLTPSSAQALEFRDTSAVFARTGSPSSYAYPGNTVLRLYTSSRHWIPADFPNEWEHHMYGVIEVPAPTTAGDGNSYFTSLWLKARAIKLDSVAGVQIVGGLYADSVISASDIAWNGVFRSTGVVNFLNSAGTAYQRIVAQEVYIGTTNYSGYSLDVNGPAIVRGYVAIGNAVYLANTLSSAVAGSAGFGALHWNGTNLMLKTANGLYQITMTAVG